MRKTHVLVVDDEELYRQALERILARAGHQVHTARNASEALAVVSDQNVAQPPVIKTAPFGYFRFRQDSYSDEEMTAWAARLKQTGWDEVYVFYKHEDEGAAPKMAARFREILS